MKIVAKRLPPTEETLRFISPFFGKEHVRKGIDERLLSAYGIFCLYLGIRLGRVRVYGCFETDDAGKPVRFLGFEYGCLDTASATFETHAVWDRHVPSAECVKLCKECMKQDYLQDGITVKWAAGYISVRNRAAILMARKVGAHDLGIRYDAQWQRQGERVPCREFRIEV